MLRTIGYVAIAVLAIMVITRTAGSAAAAVALSTVPAALVAIVATLDRDTADLIAVLQAATELIHGPARP